ncbi:hypothetical protein [Boseongicola aestuarii]|uniref:Uncharacterized protein n=1 Tax=Boseongicola aestuarii TaxID=1470561 RepID=A0A238J238_9RHOB|nr:hypothetical protein [Boseongicola aestuarii]SMX24030.1 hypothetical protein BOA8489_02145 [Boseongicola aestuarii]
MDGIVGFLFALLALGFALWLYILLPMQMAETRGRSQLGWVLISLVFSPFAAIIGLLVLGKTFELSMAESEDNTAASEIESPDSVASNVDAPGKPIQKRAAPVDGEIEEYKGYTITLAENGVNAMGQLWHDVNEARKAIDRQG